MTWGQGIKLERASFNDMGSGIKNKNKNKLYFTLVLR